MARTGADLVVEALLAAGVRHLFSLSGNQILSVYDATIGRPLSIIHPPHAAPLGAAGGARPGPGHVSLPGALLEARVSAPSRGAGPRQPAASEDLAGPM